MIIKLINLIKKKFKKITKENNSSYIPLENQSLLKLQNNFKYITHVIIDEFSMMSQSTIAKIDGRLKQAKCQPNLPFGGISIILTGDPGQLLPVGGSTLYDKRLKNQLNMSGYVIYNKFEIVVVLIKTMRQQNENNDSDQNHFIQLLQRSRNGENTIEDWSLLCERQPTAANKEEFKNAIRMFCDNNTAKLYNCDKINQLDSPKVSTNAVNSNTKCKKITADNFGGLPNINYLAIGAEIMLTANIWT